MMKFTNSVAVIAFIASMAAPQAMAATTGLDFAGGCPISEQNVGLCDQGGNADAQNVAAIIGVSESLVTYIGEGGPGFSVTGIGDDNGTWTVTDPSITHLAFKSSGYFILGAVTTGSGLWDNATFNTGSWDLSLATCPATICSNGPRAYVDADFVNGGGNVANLSNVRAFSVVPVPAAVWLFGSGLLGLVGVARRKRS
jgi:hypothetical protein